MEGTGNYGREYEITMTALYALRLSLNQEVTDVRIASNAEGYGAFDDIVIRIDYENKSKLYAIQLKHKTENDTVITTKDFSMRNGDFSIQKYKESYHEHIKNKRDALMNGISSDDVTLCLFTNTGVTGCNVFPIETSLLNCKMSPSASSPNDFVGTKSNSFQIIDISQCVTQDAEETMKLEQEADPFDNPDYIEFVQDRFVANFDEEEQGICLIDKSLFADLTRDELKRLACRFAQEKERPNDAASVSLNSYAEHKFKLKKQQEYMELFQRFLFYNNQVNYKEAKKEIEDLLESKFNDRGIAKQFVEFVRAHFDEKSPSANANTELHKKAVKLKLLELLTGIKDGELEAKYEVFKEITDMNDCTQRVGVLKTIKVSLQGRSSSSLHELTQNEKSFHQTIPIPFLLKNIKETVQVGLNENKKPAVYVRRRFHKVLLKRNVLWETTRSIFIFDVAPPPGPIRVLTHEEMGSSEFVPGDDNLVVTSRRDELDELVQKIEAHLLLRSFSLHHLTVTSDFLEWRHSWRGAEYLSKFIIDGELLPDHTVEEGEALPYFAKPLNVISASPGMGKSTVLNVLLGYCQPDVLALTLDLKTPCIQKTSDLLDCMCEQAMSGQNEEFERVLFQYLKQERRLVVFIDASDEVPPTMIETLQEHEIPIWVFTCPNATSLFEKRFSVLPITLASLTREDIANYLTRALRATPEEVSSFLTDTFVILFKTPLYLHMLVNNCKEWSDMRSLNEAELHKRFIDLSFENYMSNSNVSKEVNSKIGVFRSHWKRFERDHMNAALVAVFGSEFLSENDILDEDDFKSIREYFEDLTNHFELMVSSDDVGIPVFAHRVCAEYLAAVGIFYHPKRDVLCRALPKKEFEPVRLLFDMMLAKDDPLLLAKHCARKT